MQQDQSRDEKIRRLLGGLVKSEEGLELLRSTLFEHGQRVMPRVEFMRLPDVTDSERLARAQKGIILDSETTGLDPAADKVIQLSMLEFTYDEQGIIALGEIFDAYQDPGMPISEEITRITGITDAMVTGKTIDQSTVRDFTAGSEIVIAHNAEFDRRFVERAFPDAGFAGKDWHCSLAQIDWPARGERRGALEMLALKAGFVYDAHNSRSDILATAFVLNHKQDEGAPSPFEEMLATAAASPRHIIAIGSPFDAKDDLKARGYGWAPDDNPIHGFRKVWHRVIPGTPEALAEEASFLEGIYRRPVDLPMFTYTSRDRYSDRTPERSPNFCSKESISEMERLRYATSEPPCGITTARTTLEI